MNNVAVKYMPDTGASITVISENVVKTIGAEIKPFVMNKIKVITADGKEVKDILGFAEEDVILGNKNLEKVKMLVFRNATNPCLIGRDVLATHPDIKHHFDAIMGKQTPPTNQEATKQNGGKTRYGDRSSDDDYDEMENNLKSAAKGSWAKNKTEIDGEIIQTKAPVNVDRNICRTKINNSMEKRTSIIENVYDCNNDHQCESKEINAVQCEPESEEELAIFICVIDLIIENEEMHHSSLITSDESMVISPSAAINESWSDRKNRAKDRRRVRKLGLSDYSTLKWKSLNTDSSLLTSDMTQVTEICTHDEPSGLSFGEESHYE